MFIRNLQILSSPQQERTETSLNSNDKMYLADTACLKTYRIRFSWCSSYLACCYFCCCCFYVVLVIIVVVGSYSALPSCKL